MGVVQIIERLTKERDEARALAGLGCDARDGGAHSLMKRDNYTFCIHCGETIRTPSLRERARIAEAKLAALSDSQFAGHLVAAAPDLLEVAKMAATIDEYWVSSQEAALVKRAKAAISKANGSA